jgi:hypothetical protein
MNNYELSQDQTQAGKRKYPSATPQLVYPTATDLKPSIQTNNRQLRDTSADCLLALRIFNDPPHLFIRANRLVHAGLDEHDRRRIVPVSRDYLAGCLTRAADFFHVTEESSVKVGPPSDVVRDLLSRPTGELNLPRLLAVSETPLLRPDGSVIYESGYDPDTCMLYWPSPDLVIPPIPANLCTKGAFDAADAATDAAIDAAEVIQDAIGEFPWKDDFSRANAFALLLTLIVRPLIAGCVPLALLDAPQQGTGKGLLAEVTALIATGSAAAISAAPQGNDESEWRKTLTSHVYTGNQLVIFDNLEEPLRSASLAAAITSETWRDRILGSTAIITMPQRVVFVATGNNLTVAGDLPRRSYWVRMDARSSRPWQNRKFRHARLKQFIRQNRGRLLGALLTMASAWFQAGQPAAHSPSLGSFEEWSRIIGGILEFAGVDGFLGNLEDLYQNDPSEQQWEAFLWAIHVHFESRQFTARQLSQAMEMKTGELYAALPDELDRKDMSNKSLGRALLRKVDRRYGHKGLRLEKAGEDRNKVALWRLLI